MWLILLRRRTTERKEKYSFKHWLYLAECIVGVRLVLIHSRDCANTQHYCFKKPSVWQLCFFYRIMENWGYIFCNQPPPNAFVSFQQYCNLILLQKEEVEMRRRRKRKMSTHTNAMGLIWSRERLHMSVSTIALSRPKLSLYDDLWSNCQSFLRGIMSWLGIGMCFQVQWQLHC